MPFSHEGTSFAEPKTFCLLQDICMYVCMYVKLYLNTLASTTIYS